MLWHLVEGAGDAEARLPMSFRRILRGTPAAAVICGLLAVHPASSVASVAVETPTAVRLGASAEPAGGIVEAYCTGARRDADAAYGLGWTLLNAGQMAAAASIMQAAADLGHVGAAVVLRRLPPPSAGPLCHEEDEEQAGAAPRAAPEAIRGLVVDQADRHGLDPELILAVISAESDFRPNAVSPRMAAGLMQLMPDTARRFGVRDVFDAAESVAGGTRYLAWLLDHFGGDLSLALAGYNAGEGAVKKYGGIPPYAETIRYVRSVQDGYRRRQERPGHAPGDKRAQDLYP